MRIGDLGNAIPPLLDFLRHWFKEIFIATVLAVAAAVWLDHYHASRERDRLARNKNAVAEILAYKDGKAMAQGSGVFISPTGLLLTNYHVIAGADDVVAKLATGAFYKISGLNGADGRRDIAILQFDARETPYICGLGDSGEVEAGDKVIAIGASLGLESSVSEGVVSDPKRAVQGMELIQFTAPISSGNSGGGLFDSEGLLLGVTSATLREPQPEMTAQNINFAVPINLFKPAINNTDAAIATGTPEYFYSLGVMAEGRHDWDEAIAYYRKTISADPNYPDACLHLGGMYYEKGDYDQEVANYEKAIKLQPASYEAQYWLGTAYEDQGRYEKATDQYRAVIAMKPDAKDAIHDLILMDLVQGQRNEAAALIPKLRDLDAGLARKLELLVQRSP